MALNQAQQEAVDYAYGPCLVIAGAGSGKTGVITQKIVRLVQINGLLPRRILAVTFTNKAAMEMKERVKAKLGNAIGSKVVICTFHSLGKSIINHEYHALGLSKVISTFDEYDQLKQLKEIIQDTSPKILAQANKSENTIVKEYLELISEFKNSNANLLTFKANANFAQIFTRYQEHLKICSATDYDDLIYLPVKLFEENALVREKWQKVFDYILVDEYQDTNQVQYELLKTLSAKHNNFTVVGDDDQAIYSWRGARAENISILANDYPQLKVIKLEQNYRSNDIILNIANKVISNNPHLFDKKLFTTTKSDINANFYITDNEEHEAEYICQKIIEHQYLNNTKWSDYAILYRSNSQSKVIEKALSFNSIPSVVYGGTSFFDYPEVKDIFAWFRIILNPKDNAAFLRVINIPSRGVGPKCLNVLSKLALEQNTSMLIASKSDKLQDHLNENQIKSLNDFARKIIHARNLIINHQELELLSNFVDFTDYSRYLKITSSSDKAYAFKLSNVNTFISLIYDLITGKGKYEKLSILEAVEKLSIRQMLDNNTDKQSEALQLMTLHASKGLEFKYVYLIGMEEGLLPHKNSLEQDGLQEERRLCYVGITRAKKEINFSMASTRVKANKADKFNKIKRTASRFINEMPKEYVQTINVTHQYLRKNSTQEDFEKYEQKGISMLKELINQ